MKTMYLRGLYIITKMFSSIFKGLYTNDTTNNNENLATINEKNKDYILFYTDKDDEELGCQFKISDTETFLSMICMVLSGQVSESTLSLIFSAIDNDDIKEEFIQSLLETSQETLESISNNQKPVIKPSEFGRGEMQ